MLYYQYAILITQSKRNVKSQNNKDQRIWNLKAISITKQVTAHMRKVTFVTHYLEFGGFF